MSSYHTSFTYLNRNSVDEGFIVASFKPDDGFTDAFLDMDQISEDYYDGTKKFLYGTKYRTTATISITLIKADGSNFTIADNRRVLKWLTGARTASWLDLYNGHEFQYSFLGTMKNPQQYKFDGRVIGISVEFSSLSPWAFSEPKVFNRSISQSLFVDDDGVLIKDPMKEMSVNDDGVLCNSIVPDEGACFRYKVDDDQGIVYVDELIVARLNNDTDDPYSYIYLDIEYLNDTCKYLEIKNETLNETTRVDNIGLQDKIYITGKQFIIAYTKDQLTGEFVNQNRIFGDDFNFVWPRLAPGVNIFTIEGNGNGTVEFTYRYPIKIGDCAMDISTYGGGIECCDGSDIPTYNTVRWQDITGTPTSISGYGITDAYTTGQVYTKDEVYSKDEVYHKNDLYTKEEVYNKNEVYSKDQVYNKNETYSNNDVYTKDEVYSKDETYSSDMVYTKDDLYTKVEVDSKIEIGGGSGSGSVTVDEEELNNMLNDILN